MNRSRKRIALAVSLTLHAVLLLVLMFWYLPQRGNPNTASVAEQSQDVNTAETAKAPPRSESPAQPVEPPQADVPEEQIRASVESQVEQAERLPDERKLSELEKNLRRLDSIADEQAVQETSAAVAESLGLDSNQYAPKPETAAGTFDASTAQIDDVLRTGNEQSGWRYESVMVDAAGRKLTVPIPPAEGERLYQTFELMKRYPAASGIYRGVVMPMIQKMLAAETQSTGGASPTDTPAGGLPDGNRVIQPAGPEVTEEP
jgi:hypothetical protein